MRIAVDYRSALRARTGVGEYVHQVCRALCQHFGDARLTLFTSSWKDRPRIDMARDFPGARVVDYRVPVSALNYSWHNLEWPPIEWLTGEEYDVVFSPHPLLLPARRAAQVVMIHDLDFMRAPHRTTREIRRDYPRLAAAHAQRAARIVVPSAYTSGEAVRVLGAPRSKIDVCPPGVPEWPAHVPARTARDGYILFVGTLEPRKNVGTLIAAYRRLLARGTPLPKLVLAGAAAPEASGWLEALKEAPLAPHAEYLGYVADDARPHLYSGACVVVLPSFDEGFGMPLLEAMSLGIPVIASRRGALPDLVGDAGLLFDAEDPEALADAIERVVGDGTVAAMLSHRGRARARQFTWARTAAMLHASFRAALEPRVARRLSAAAID